MFDQLLAGLDMVFAWENFIWAFFGVAFGMVMGAIPGLTDTMAIVLLLPFTYYLGPIAGMSMLMGLSKGGNFGGSIPAILFNIPGTPQAMVTCFDGYPLTQQGKSGKALQVALFASVTADAMSDLVLIFLAAPVAMVALKIGPPEYSMIVLFSLVIISIAATDDPRRGLLSTGIGLLLATVGTDPEYGTPRFMFGLVDLAEGFALMPMVIGLLAFSEVLTQTEKYFVARRKAAGAAGDLPQNSRGASSETGSGADDNRLSFSEAKSTFPTIGRSTLIGSLVGIIPGIGTTVGSYLSYLWARKNSKHPELFGKGALDGIAASEAGNNAVNGPNLIPLVTLGIPGNLAAALLLGGFMMKGLTPGPRFMEDHAPLLYALFAVLLLSNLFTLLIGKVFIRYARLLVKIPQSALYTGILVFSIIGAYVFNGSMFDVYVMFGFGLFGYLLSKCKINLPTLIVAFFLGQLLEHKIRQSLLISGGDWTVFFTRPIALAFVILTVLISAIYLKKIRKTPLANIQD